MVGSAHPTDKASMQLSGLQLEKIVTEVMVELFRPAVQRSGGIGSAAPQATAVVARAEAARPVVASGGVAVAKPPSGELVERAAVESAVAVVALVEKVITGALLEEKGRGVKRIAVHPTAVLTPSARDFVRKHGIEVTKEAASASGAASSKSREAVRWQLLVSKAGPGVLAAADAWVQECGWRRKELVGTAREAAAKAVAAVATAEAAGVIVLTDRVDEACLLVNRNEKVRGVVSSSVRGVQASIAQVGANVFVIDPTNRGAFELRQILKAVVEGGKPKDRFAA